ncbi:tetratricopeptide repeat protein [Colwellia echini]|uniref:Tetratricopeptide repeat protein n=1 Tax=Colwellia echini TaxID=1982103 RepID=A0ABY3MW13_9GAMM|nr:tetratricopeptide repeat protein [Colwellia echini]TYK65402.1 tetratricopeptide repeat protein [Colwellia echini]
MLFKQFTKAAILAIILSLWLSGCSSKPAVESTDDIENSNSTANATTNAAKNNTTDDADTLQTDAVKVGQDPVEVGKAAKVKVKHIPAINLYEEQQAKTPVIVPDKVLEDYQQAIALMKVKKWQQADALLDQVILAQPNLSGSYVNKALIAQQQGELVEAQALLDKAISINNLNLYAHHLQGQIYRLQGQFNKAEQSYLAALAIWPDFNDAQVSMAILLELYRGRLIDAHGYYTSYLTLNSDDEEVKRWQAGLEIKITRAGLEIPVVEDAATEDVMTESVIDIETDSVDDQLDESATVTVNEPGNINTEAENNE